MTALAPLSPDSARDFLARFPETQWIDLLVFDLNGIARGKRIPSHALLSVAEDGLMLPLTVYAIDPRGNCIEETDLIWETGDPDIPFNILSGSLQPCSSPSDVTGVAQAILAPTDERGRAIDPLSLLDQQQAELNALGYTASVAVELEFYLIKKPDGQLFAPVPPGDIVGHGGWPHLFAFRDLDQIQPFVEDVYGQAERQGFKPGSLLQEAGPGQFEINLQHRSCAVSAALDGVMLKRVIQSAANRHCMSALFMAKPHHDWPGCGMHIHVGMQSRDGDVLFGKPNGSLAKAETSVLGGLQKSMADFMAIWAPTANAYRRFVPRNYAPMHASWGYNNRNVAIRLPQPLTETAARLEHRVSGSDANIMLVIAAILAGVNDGLRSNCPCSAATEGDQIQDKSTPLPVEWVNALEQFRHSDIAVRAFGPDFHKLYCDLKTTERTAFETTVTGLDYIWYAQT